MQDSESSPWGLVGVAPEATLGMYRVFGCSGSSPSDIVMKAMEQAIVDKVDILSLSLGSTQIFEADDQYKVYTTALETKGIAVIVSNGNNGAVLAGLPSTCVQYFSSFAEITNALGQSCYRKRSHWSRIRTELAFSHYLFVQGFSRTIYEIFWRPLVRQTFPSLIRHLLVS